jgi:hypothetical protein
MNKGRFYAYKPVRFGGCLLLLEIEIIEWNPMPGGGFYLAIPQQRKAVGETNVTGLGIARSFVDVISHRK